MKSVRIKAMEELKEDAASLSYKGDWPALISLLGRWPELANTPSDKQHFTPLHQAAWHGASLSVVGQLLSIGADRTARSVKDLTPQEVARKRHPDRDDLQYILAPGRRSLAQLLRKFVSEHRNIFHSYDGNLVVLDRVIERLSSDLFQLGQSDAGEALDIAFRAVTGVSLGSTRDLEFKIGANFVFQVDPAFWRDRLLADLVAMDRRANLIPIEEHWATIADLFDPAPQQWEARGNLFLWLEMRQAFCHVKMPLNMDQLRSTIASAFEALTGHRLDAEANFYVERFSRGGMSSGTILGSFWEHHFMPLIQQRALWLIASWSR
jgi:hypothetical protein